MSATPESNGQTRENAATHVSSELRQRLREKFAEKYKPRGRSRALMEEFTGDWCRELDTKPPSKETVRLFLVKENGRDTFEYRIVDGSCRLLLGCSFDEWINSPKQAQDTLQELSSPPQSNSETYHLNEAIPAPLDKLSYVPNLPPNFLPRPDEFKAIKTAVLVSTNQSIAVTGTAHRVGVQGMGGIGKSVLTAAIARDEEVRRAFPDGVLWVTLGQTPILTSWQSHLAEVLGAGHRTFTDVQLGKAFLGELLADKACLLILDDVWQTKHAAAFDTLGQRCKMLLTTRDRGLITGLGAVECQLGVLSDKQALALLALWAGQHEETLPTEAHEVIRECGNLPLALAMIGAMVRGKPDRWGNVLHKLRNADLEKIRHQFPDYPYSDLLKAIQVSVEDLEPDVQRRYLDFAVFPEDTPIPEAALQTFWEPEGLDQHETQDVVDLLVERSLVRRDDKGHLSLHDLQYDYVRKQAGDLSVLHNQLLSAYAKQCPNGWHTGTNDGYFFEHLAYHLKESERKEELYSLLTESPDWMEAKFVACTGDAAYVADLELALKDFSEPLEPLQLLTLTQLHTARQVVNQRVSNYDDIDLETLVWLGREQEAFSHARLRHRLANQFNGLLAVCKALQQQGQSNLELFCELQEIAFAIPTSSLFKEGILVDLAVAIAQTDYWKEFSLVFEDAEKLARPISDRDARHPYLLLKLATVFDRVGQKTKADRIFTEVREAARSKDNREYCAGVLIRLVATLSQIGRFSEAKQVARNIESEDLKLQEQCELVVALAQAGDTAEAYAVFTKIKAFIKAIDFSLAKNDHNLAIILGELAVALTQFGYKSDAEQVFTKAKQAVLIKSLWQPEILLSSLIHNLAKAARFNEARELARTIPKDNEFRSKALSALANTLAQFGDKTEAKEIFMEAKEAASLNDDIAASVATSNLAAALVQTGYEAQAESIFTKVREAATTTKNDYEKVEMLSAVAVALAHADCVSDAQELIDMIPLKDTERLKGLSVLAVALERKRQMAEADRVFTEAKKIAEECLQNAQSMADISCIPLSVLVTALAQVERFKEAEEVTNGIEDDLEKAKALSAIAAFLANAGHSVDSDRIFINAREATYAVEDFSRRQFALCSLAAALSQAGYFSKAKELVQTIHDDWYLVLDWNGLATPFAKAGRFLEAFTILGWQRLDLFLCDLTEWASAFEGAESGLSVAVLREAVRIAGWVRPSWREIYELFPARTTS
jgi:tetratricopeptide (TPR) repeat protein